MKLIFSIFFILLNGYCYSQNFNSKNWKDFNYDDGKHYTVTKTEKFTINNVLYDIVWDENMTYSKSLKQYIGGVKSLKIYKGNKLVNTFENIKDFIGLGEIYFDFYDYNFDGYMDFSYPINDGAHIWRTYYLYNKEKHHFINYKDWDYVTISKTNRVTKQILSQFDGNCCEGDKSLHQVSVYKINLLKTFHYKDSPN